MVYGCCMENEDGDDGPRALQYEDITSSKDENISGREVLYGFIDNGVTEDRYMYPNAGF